MENANIILFVIVIAVGLIIIFLGIRQYFQAKNAEKNWLKVSGVVLESNLSSFRTRNSRGNYTTKYRPHVAYKYQVDGQTFHSDRLAFGSESTSESNGRKKIAIYPEGSQVTVHYAPGNPAKAVLETKAYGVIYNILLGLFFIALGILAMIVS